MSSEHMNAMHGKSAYTTPTLVEYGSLAERTKIFGLPQGPVPDSVFGGVITTGSRSVSTVVS
jgi:hypothetical protein